jgi:hypothetical protein
MSRSAALRAIARAEVQGGHVDTANAALGREDPLLRARARRRVRDACAHALAATTIRRGDEGARHVLRIAYLTIAGSPPDPAAIDDVAAVESAYLAAR